MPTRTDDAEIEVVLNTAEAVRQAKELEDQLDSGASDRGRKRKEKGDRDRRDDGRPGKGRTTVIPVASKLGARLFGVFAVLGLIEAFGPLIAEGVREFPLLKEIPGIKQALNLTGNTVDALSLQVAFLRASFTSLLVASGQTVDVARAQILIGGQADAAALFAEGGVFERARRVATFNARQGAIRTRITKQVNVRVLAEIAKTTPEILGGVVVDIFSGIFSDVFGSIPARKAFWATMSDFIKAGIGK